MSDNIILDFSDAASIIKDAIVRSRYQAAKLINKELLSLYYAVGKYVSENSRGNAWGQGAIRQLSDMLQRELPGLRGFSETSIRKMRLFYEGWHPVFTNHPLSTDDLNETKQNDTHHLLTNEIQSDQVVLANRPLSMDDSCEHSSSINRSLPTDEFEFTVKTNSILDLNLLLCDVSMFAADGFSQEAFYSVGFTHHSEILAKEKTLQGRLYYIARCAEAFWTVETLKSNLRGELYSRAGTMPNNFMQTLPDSEQARRAIRVFKDEYLLEFINPITITAPA